MLAWKTESSVVDVTVVVILFGLLPEEFSVSEREEKEEVVFEPEGSWVRWGDRHYGGTMQI